jgi:sulfur carrier protein
MELTLNNDILKFEDDSTLQVVLESMDLINKKGIAVAVNASVIPKTNWNNFKLTNKDKIMVITATAGG